MYDIPYCDLYLHFNSQNTDFLGRKYEIWILVKNIHFFNSFLIVVQPNQGVQQKDRLFRAACFLC